MSKNILYVSEITQFINQLKEKNPGLEHKQQEGRKLLWDKKVDFEDLQAARKLLLPKPPYTYYEE